MRSLAIVLSLVLGVHAAMTTAEAAPEARIEFNGTPLDDAGRRTLRQIEAQIGAVPAGRYWYDAASGAAGVWGGPASAYLGPGLALGGPLPAAASGGGSGRVTGVFVNGRELHVVDVQGLGQVLPVQRGRYWWDAAGNVGPEGGPMLFNFYWLLQQQRSAAASTYRSGARPGESTFVAKGCTAVHGRLRASDSGSDYSYYVGC
jgi:hypothetical protein